MQVKLAEVVTFYCQSAEMNSVTVNATSLLYALLTVIQRNWGLKYVKDFAVSS